MNESMKKIKHEELYEQICHKSEDLPLKIYKTNSVYLHWHEEYEFIMVEKGSVLCVINGETIELTENKALLLHGGDLHSIHNNTNSKIIAIVASSTLWEDETFTALFKEPVKFQSVFTNNDPIDRSVMEILKQIINLYNDKNFGYRFAIKAKFAALFELLIINKRFTYFPQNAPHLPSALKSLMNYVHEHYAEKISLSTLSSVSFYSQTYIIKLFKRYTNLTPAEYITQYRLEIAKEKLQNGLDNNLSIALRCGFNSETYFIRAFKKRYGLTPYAYRKQQQSAAE